MPHYNNCCPPVGPTRIPLPQVLEGDVNANGHAIHNMDMSEYAYLWAHPEDIHDPIVRVREFGAVGDGVTDDTAAIQAALARLLSIGGGILLFDQKTYRIASQAQALSHWVGWSWPCAFLISGLTENDSIHIAGNGAVLKIEAPVTYMVFGINTEFHTIKFSDLTFTRALIPANIIPDAIFHLSSFGTNPLSNTLNAISYSQLLEITHCNFIGMDRAYSTEDGGARCCDDHLAKLVFSRNNLIYPWGTGSTLMNGRPQVGILLNSYPAIFECERNYFDGASDPIDAGWGTTKLAKDGFVYSEAHTNYIRNNHVINFYIEGLMTLYQGVITAVHDAVAPAVGANATFPFYEQPGSDYLLTVGQLVAINSSNVYAPLGRYEIMSVNWGAKTFVGRNTGYTQTDKYGLTVFTNAPAGTTTGPHAYVRMIEEGLKNPGRMFAEFSGNYLNQKVVSGNLGTRNNPCIAAYADLARITGNTIVRSVWGISVNGGGAISRDQVTYQADNSVVQGNQIELDIWSALHGSQGGHYYGISQFACLYTEISDNTIIAPTSKGVTGIASTRVGHIKGNSVIARVRSDFLPEYESMAYRVTNGCNGTVFEGNVGLNFDYGIRGGGNLENLVGSNFFRDMNGHRDISEAITYNPLLENRMATRFTPTTTEWYRIAEGWQGWMGGRVEIRANYNGGIVDVAFEFGIGGYGIGTQFINQTRHAAYGQPPVVGARVSSLGPKVFLDILVQEVAAGGVVGGGDVGDVYCNFYGQWLVNNDIYPGINRAPVHLASIAGHQDVLLLAFGSGFNTSKEYRVNGTKVLGAQGDPVDNAADAPGVVTQFNTLLQRLRAHGIIKV